MGVIVKISRNTSKLAVKKALEKLSKKSARIKNKTLKDYFGKLPDTYGDGLAYQKKVRNEW